MKVTVRFGDISVVVPCGDGELLIKDLIVEAIKRYKKATRKLPDHEVSVQNLLTLNEAYLDEDDQTKDVIEDNDCIIAVFDELDATQDRSCSKTSDVPHAVRDTSGISQSDSKKHIKRIDSDVADELMFDMTCEPSRDHSDSEACNQDDEVSTESTKRNLHWSRRAILLLLRLYKQFLPIARIRKVKGIKIWKAIAKIMTAKGYLFSYVVCEKKWRNMKATYNKIRDKNDSSGCASVKWEFYALMDELCQTSSADAKFKTTRQWPFNTDSFSNYLDALNSNLATTDMTTDTESTQLLKEAQFPHLLSESQDVGEESELDMACASFVDHSDSEAGNQEENVSTGTLHWSARAILLLLRLYKQFLPIFRSKTVKKIEIWKAIAKSMNEKGYIFDYVVCEKKWRNMKSTYNKIRERDNVSERASVKWEYYTLMDELCQSSSSDAELGHEQQQCTSDSVSDSTQLLEKSLVPDLLSETQVPVCSDQNWCS